MVRITKHSASIVAVLGYLALVAVVALKTDIVWALAAVGLGLLFVGVFVLSDADDKAHAARETE